MEKLTISPTIKTPRVEFDADTGVLSMAGKSIPENSFELFAPIVEWIAAYIESPADTTEFIFKLSYFNSSSTEYILDIMKRLDKLNSDAHAVKVKWFYSEEDEDMEQVGEDFKMMLDLSIEMIAISEAEMEKVIEE